MRPFELLQATGPADATSRATYEPADIPSVHAPAMFLAGGTTVLDLMKIDVMRPGRLVDIAPLSRGLSEIDVSAHEVRLGAMVRMADAAADARLEAKFPVLVQSLRDAASPQLRNMATLAGNLLQRTRCAYFRDTRSTMCNKRDPGSGCAAMRGIRRRLAVLGTSEHCIANYPGDFAVALVALDAVVETLAADGSRRRIAVDALHRLPGDTPHLETILQPGELITGFVVAHEPWMRRSLYVKVRDRASYDFALASAAVALHLGAGGVVEDVRIGLGGVGTKPWRAREAEALLRGGRIDEATVDAAATAAFAQAIATGDARGKPEIGRRALMSALLRAARMEL
jgi:xanthine dehydrogenase YagS FAD-binding subunit